MGYFQTHAGNAAQKESEELCSSGGVLAFKSIYDKGLFAFGGIFTAICMAIQIP
ncbi:MULTISPECIES: hypothetical protein [unclassified Shinella]|uniref:hypothetical protein n=1 Tax=unclassified Shinella TaxID=2643062 RepID=UPI000B2D0652|nr:MULTISPECIES: hypothetical protein [unclassified Shinella]